MSLENRHAQIRRLCCVCFYFLSSLGSKGAPKKWLTSVQNHWPQTGAYKLLIIRVLRSVIMTGHRACHQATNTWKCTSWRPITELQNRLCSLWRDYQAVWNEVWLCPPLPTNPLTAELTCPAPPPKFMSKHLEATDRNRSIMVLTITLTPLLFKHEDIRQPCDGLFSHVYTHTRKHTHTHTQSQEQLFGPRP